MIKDKIYAVITGDIVASKRFTKDWPHFLEVLEQSFNYVKKRFNIRDSFNQFRGDGFQIILLKPEDALNIAISLRASLRYYFKKSQRRKNLPDAKIVIGIGKLDYLPKNSTSSTGIGAAFDRSGPKLDAITKRKFKRYLIINSPWEKINDELDVECALLDMLIQKWSPEQAQVILYNMEGLTQVEMANKIGISQKAVADRLKNAGGNSIGLLCKRYESLINNNISPVTINDNI
ncbi:MAG: hypothetical protein IMZ60_01155 [Actinobacteria bacterium]|nr:hypothetical protein [Actinomycetota bacterium]